MPAYVLLTKIAPEAMSQPERLAKLEAQVKQRVKKHCRGVKWILNLAVMGPYDYLDVFEAPDQITASKVSTIVRSFGHATTETWGAVTWSKFKACLGELKG
jgi:uncharacterized protein with GYD domain